MIAVAESGIRTPADIERLSAVGLLRVSRRRAPDCRARSRRGAGGAARGALKALAMMTRVKICGIRRMRRRAARRRARGGCARLRLLAFEPALSRARGRAGDCRGAAAVCDDGGRVRRSARDAMCRMSRDCSIWARFSCTATKRWTRTAECPSRMIKAVAVREGQDCLAAVCGHSRRRDRAARCPRSGQARRHRSDDRLDAGRLGREGCGRSSCRVD